MVGKLVEATLRLVFGESGQIVLRGELVMEILGRRTCVECDPGEIIAIHQAAVAAMHEGGSFSEEKVLSEEATANDHEPPWNFQPQEVILGQEDPHPPASSSAMNMPLSVPQQVGEPGGPPPPKRIPPVRVLIQKDTAGNPIVPAVTNGVDPLKVLGVKNPGDNGVDLL